MPVKIHIIDDLSLTKELMSSPTKLYNDNMNFIHWSRNSTSKNIRHLQIQDNAIRESVQNRTVAIIHIEGKINPADIFTKEEIDIAHYLLVRNSIVLIHFPSNI